MTILYHAKIKSEPDYAYKFAQEVRRYYPFVPFLPGKAKTDIDFQGVTIPAGHGLAIDVYGTLHDESLWEDPNEFRRKDLKDGTVHRLTLFLKAAAITGLTTVVPVSGLQ